MKLKVDNNFCNELVKKSTKFTL